MNYRKAMLGWGLTLILFIISALVCVSLIFQPVVMHAEYTDMNGKQHIYSAPRATSIEGMILRAEAWKEYPEYNIGLGFVAVLSFLGALHASRSMYQLKGAESEE